MRGVVYSLLVVRWSVSESPDLNISGTTIFKDMGDSSHCATGGYYIIKEGNSFAIKWSGQAECIFQIMFSFRGIKGKLGLSMSVSYATCQINGNAKFPGWTTDYLKCLIESTLA